jgi:pimeloyl-ACP methyl ester carboxylesterase
MYSSMGVRTWRAARSTGPRLHWFTRPGGESHAFNMFPNLGRIQCPTLVRGVEDDPMIPIECQADIAAPLPPHLVPFERFANCGHAVVPDAPERAIAMIRDFIAHR